MGFRYQIITGLVIALLFTAGCTLPSGQTSTPVTVVTTEIPQATTEPVKSVEVKPWTCVGSGSNSGDEPRIPYMYERTDPNTPIYQALPAPGPAPAYTGATMPDDPILGTYIFEPSQFAAKDVEKMDYFSELSSTEFYYVVPLDISPDIQWTFRDDGVLLFYQNNISSSDTSLRRFWRNSSGYFLRSGTWKVIQSEKDKTVYQINWGCTVQRIHNYVVTYDRTGVTLTQPTVLKMVKINQQT